MVDWLPWNHTFGANHNFNLVLRHAGTLYIDGGRPVPGLIEQTVRNLREVSPTIYFNVPGGLRGAAAASRSATTRWRDASSRGCALSSMPARRCRRTCGRGWRTSRCAPSASACR